MKTIAIVGATEKNGRILVNQFACMPYRFLLVSNKINELEELTIDISEKYPKAEVESLNCIKDGCWEADIIILAVPHNEEKMIAELMKEVATQKIVVDFSNEKNAEDQLCSILPYSKLVRISGDFTSKEIVVSGNDEAVNEEISQIFNQAGYHTTIENHSLQLN